MAFLPAIAAVASVAGGVLSGVGQMQAAKAAASADEYNARAAEMTARAEREAADEEARDTRRKLMGRRASSIADRGASGVALAGTPLMVDENVMQEIELDVARTAHRGATKATSLENQATLDRMSAANRRRAAPLSAGASILGGIASARY